VRVLRARLAVEPCGFVRAALCEGLAAAGEPLEPAALLALLASVHDVEPIARAAFALSRVRTDAGHAALVGVLNDPAAPATVRAAALEALGRKLGERSPRLAQLAAQLNWAVVPGWLRTVLGTTL
jgi:HEAT repeat protein